MSTESAFLTRMRNLAQITDNSVKSLVNNPNKLKRDSLILASLVLVCSRMFVSNYSAIKAKGTPEAHMRYREAIRTNIREPMGFFAGFIILRQIERFIRNFMGKKLGIEEKPNPNPYRLWPALKDWFKNPTKKVAELNINLTADLKPSIKSMENPNIQKLIGGVQWLSKKFNKNWLTKPAAQEAFIRQFYNLGPIVAASVPAVILAGVVLEKLTRDYSDRVVDFISSHLSSKGKPNGAPQKPMASPMPMPATFGANPQPALFQPAGRGPVPFKPSAYPNAIPNYGLRYSPGFFAGGLGR